MKKQVKTSIDEVNKYISEGRIEQVNKLIPKIAINGRDQYGDSPLFTACYFGEGALVRLLVERGADVNVPNSLGYSPLHEAYFLGYQEIVEYLVVQGADVNSQNNMGEMPLHLHHNACEVGHKEMVHWLVERGANVQGRTYDGSTPLHIASFQGCEELVNLLVETYKADVNLEDNRGRTPLHHACQARSPEIIRSLVARGADVNRRDHEGRTSLHHACSDQELDSDKELIDDFVTSIDISDLDIDQETILNRMTEIEKKAKEVVKLLVEEYHVDIHCQDHKGKTPFHYAWACNDKKLAGFLAGLSLVKK